LDLIYLKKWALHNKEESVLIKKMLFLNQ